MIPLFVFQHLTQQSRSNQGLVKLKQRISTLYICLGTKSSCGLDVYSLTFFTGKGLQGWPTLASLADGNWLMKQNQPVSKIETKSDTNLRSLYES